MSRGGSKAQVLDSRVLGIVAAALLMIGWLFIGPLASSAQTQINCNQNNNANFGNQTSDQRQYARDITGGSGGNAINQYSGNGIGGGAAASQYSTATGGAGTGSSTATGGQGGNATQRQSARLDQTASPIQTCISGSSSPSTPSSSSSSVVPSDNDIEFVTQPEGEVQDVSDVLGGELLNTGIPIRPTAALTAGLPGGALAGILAALVTAGVVGASVWQFRSWRGRSGD